MQVDLFVAKLPSFCVHIISYSFVAELEGKEILDPRVLWLGNHIYYSHELWTNPKMSENNISLLTVTWLYYCWLYSLQDEMFQKFNFDTEWAVRLISKITNDEDLPIEGDTIVKQVSSSFIYFLCDSIIVILYHRAFPCKFSLILLICLFSLAL